MVKEDQMIEIFASPDGRIAYKETSTDKIYELEPTSTHVVGPEGYVNITEGMWIVMPVGGGESWSVDILVDESGHLVIFVEMIDVYIKADKIPISPEHLKEYKFESKGTVNLSDKISEAKRRSSS